MVSFGFVFSCFMDRITEWSSITLEVVGETCQRTSEQLNNLVTKNFL